MTSRINPPLGETFHNSIQEMVPLADFHTFVRKLIGDVSSLVLDDSIQEAIRWFCDESYVLVDETTIHFQRGVRDYVLMVPDHQLLLAPDLAPWWAANGVQSHGARTADDYFFGDIFGYGRSGYTVSRDGPHPVIEFAYEPRHERPRIIPYAWTPNRDFCQVPRLLYDMWMLPIKYRAAAEILLMPGEEFSSMRRSEFFNHKAKEGLDRARRWKAQNYSQQPRRMQVRPFLRGTIGRRYYGGLYGGGFY